MSDTRRSIRIEIHGVDLPGRSCGPRPDGGTYEDIQVGLKCRAETIELIPGDVAEARWSMDVTIRETPAGRDFGGPFVSGARDDRHLGLRWFGRAPDGTYELFRGAKLRLIDVTPAFVDEALRTGGTLVGRVVMSDDNGWPRCARVRPPAVTWSVRSD
jgi:hypothetical protein